MTQAPAPHPEDRHRSPYSTREKVARMLWAVVQATLFRGSFHNWYGRRRFLLRRFGVNVAPEQLLALARALP